MPWVDEDGGIVYHSFLPLNFIGDVDGLDLIGGTSETQAGR